MRKSLVNLVPASQKAPSAKRCIKTHPRFASVAGFLAEGQKAPSAIRCIKTSFLFRGGVFLCLVRKHLAP